VTLRHWQATACVAVTLMSAIQPLAAQQVAAQQVAAQQVAAQQVSPTAPAAPQPLQNDTTGTPGLPQAPQPTLTQPLYLRPTLKDYGRGKTGFPNPLRWYTASDYPAPRLSNTPRLDNLLVDGKIYLSLSDAVTLALENNYDIAIARINLDIADADLLRAKAGSSLRGVSTGIVGNTLGGTTTTISGGGGPPRVLRSGRNVERLGRRRRWSFGPRAEHQRWWTAAGGARSGADRAVGV
jgi:outer membrane protein